MNGKGDTPRPRLVGQEEYSERWEGTFGVVTPSPQPNERGDWVAVVDGGPDAFECEAAPPTLDVPPERP